MRNINRKDIKRSFRNASKRELMLFGLLFGVILSVSLFGRSNYTRILTAKAEINKEVNNYTVDTVTPIYGIKVATQGFKTNLGDIDVKYSKVLTCLGYHEYQKRNFASTITVVIKTGGGGFECGASSTGRCLGLYDAHWGAAYVPANLSSLAHEIVHHFVTMGHTNPLIDKCGDCIDETYVKEGARSSLKIRQCSKNNILTITKD